MAGNPSTSQLFLPPQKQKKKEKTSLQGGESEFLLLAILIADPCAPFPVTYRSAAPLKHRTALQPVKWDYREIVAHPGYSVTKSNLTIPYYLSEYMSMSTCTSLILRKLRTGGFAPGAYR